MKKKNKIPKIVVYGTNNQAAALYMMIEKEKQANVEAFIMDREFRNCDKFMNLPVVNFDEIQEKYPPEDYEVCLSFGYKNMVHNRQEKFMKCKQKGYTIYTFISKNAIVYSGDIGEGCNIYPGTVLAPFTKVGMGSFIESGCVVAHDTEIGDFNFVAPGAHFCGGIKTGNFCFFGGAVEIVNGCKIGNEVFVGAMGKVSKNLLSGEVILPSKSHGINKNSFEMMEYMFRGREE